MKPETDALSREAMKAAYGAFWNASPRVSISDTRIPDELRILIPYAEFWGLSDDWARESLVAEAPVDVQNNLKSVVKRYEEIWEPWLAGPEAHNTSPTKEYVAFSALVMAADYIGD